jgi:NOL1/NOP2/fmu family ribosome biogenesis protein
MALQTDRLVCRSQISILEASTPNLLIVHDAFVSLLGAALPCLENWWVPREGLSFMALQTDRSIHPDRLVCRSRINILEASTPNLLIVHDPFVSLLRAPLPCLEHWWMPREGLSFMALQTDRSIPIDWSVGAGLAFSRRPPPIC